MGQSNRQWELQIRTLLISLERVLNRLPDGPERDDLQEIVDILKQSLSRP